MPEMPAQVSLTPEQIAAFQADPNQWLRSVLEGQYLGANPYIDQLIQAMEADAQRQFQESILPTRRSELNLSGAYGTALGAQAEAKAAEDFARGLMGQTAGIRFQDYGAERDRMQQALQLLSGETLASRQGLFGARGEDVQSATGIRQSEIAAAAQGAASRMGMRGQLGAARIGQSGANYRARLAAQQNYWNNVFNRSQQMRGFFGGPGQPMGQRGQVGVPTSQPVYGPVGTGLWGGPAGGVAQGPPTADPWNVEGF